MEPAHFINRELSWLDFNARVLDEARDAAVPLLERLKFLAITASNLDEFFMVRVGGLQMLASQGIVTPDPSGLSPALQLAAIEERTRQMVAALYDCYRDGLEPALAQAGIRRVRRPDMSDRQLAHAEQYFAHEVFPVVTPMAVAAGSPFPLLANRMIYAAVRLKPAPDGGEDKPRFALIPLGRNLSRFVTLPGTGTGTYEYVLLEDIVCMMVDRFFPGETILEAMPFRITRNADLSVREDSAGDFLTQMEGIIDARKEGQCIRMEIEESATKITASFLQKALAIDDRQTYRINGPLDLSAFMTLASARGFEQLKYEPWPPQPAIDIVPGASMFATIASRNILLCHPYESFDPVVRLVEEAAADPDVVAIKQILYRTSKTSPIVEALRKAAERGKYVTALVELKARFDEERNIEWARTLEQAGVQVIYGVKGLKTHAKILIIVRREPQGLRRYLHFGTGNYNEITARIYSDASYMTCDEDLGADASAFFNTITGYSQPQRFRALEAAPLGLRERITELIRGEAERRRQGQKAFIMAKLNSLADPAIVDELYAASQAGVKIQLNVRGICCLRPGIPKVSDNISVVSIIDRFLEHSRILYFHQGGEEKIFISSADWMTRNLDKRVELLVPIEDVDCRRRLVAILETYFRDTAKASRLLPDGKYERVAPPGRKTVLRSQEALYRQVCETIRQARQSKPTAFETHTPAGAG